MNKIVVSIALVLILILGINKITDVIYYVEKPEKSVYQADDIASKVATGMSSEEGEVQNIMALFASTNASEGAKIFKKCAACHSIAQGGGNKIGPALWGVIGRKAGSITDYKYSKALAAHAKIWTFEEMDGFLIKPKDWIKGTKMSFAGLKDPKERAAIILYMNENSSSPLPIN